MKHVDYFVMTRDAVLLGKQVPMFWENSYFYVRRDGDSRFARNVSVCPLKYTALCSRRQETSLVSPRRPQISHRKVQRVRSMQGCE